MRRFSLLILAAVLTFLAVAPSQADAFVPRPYRSLYYPSASYYYNPGPGLWAQGIGYSPAYGYYRPAYYPPAIYNPPVYYNSVQTYYPYPATYSSYYQPSYYAPVTPYLSGYYYP